EREAGEKKDSRQAEGKEAAHGGLCLVAATPGGGHGRSRPAAEGLRRSEVHVAEARAARRGGAGGDGGPRGQGPGRQGGGGGGGRGWARPGPPLSSWGSRAVVRHALVGGVGVAIPALGSAAPSTPVAVLCPCATILMW